MDSILRSRRTQTHHGEHLRLSDDYQISQEGSRFGETHVTGGSVFQGNFVGLSISQCPLPANHLTSIFTTLTTC